jgi:hexokinase
MTNSDLSRITQSFTTELIKATGEETTSLPFIRHTLPPFPTTPPDAFQSLVIGGSLTQSAIVRNHELSNITKISQPHLPTLQAFLQHLEAVIDPAMSTLVLNFAYPLTPVIHNSLLDGILIAGTKENKFEGLLGKAIGQTIADHFQNKHNRILTVTVANDAICLLLAGLPTSSPDDIVGGIIGTGLNFAFFLDNNTMVNTESGNFSSFVQSNEGKEIDTKSAHPGSGLFEKEVSGAYLYQHFNLLCQTFTLAAPVLTSTKQLADIAQKQIPDLSPLAQSLLKRSAQLVATQVAGISQYKKRDLTFIIEGSLFCDNAFYRQTVMTTAASLATPYLCQFKKLTESSLRGAAELVYHN